MEIKTKEKIADSYQFHLDRLIEKFGREEIEGCTTLNFEHGSFGSQLYTHKDTEEGFFRAHESVISSSTKEDVVDYFETYTEHLKKKKNAEEYKEFLDWKAQNGK